MAGALRNLPGELKGEYCPLSELSPSLQEELIRGHYLFHDKNKFRRTAGAYEDWPAGRGIFFNREKSFLVWVGEEDQVRIILFQGSLSLSLSLSPPSPLSLSLSLSYCAKISIYLFHNCLSCFFLPRPPPPPPPPPSPSPFMCIKMNLR